MLWGSSSFCIATEPSSDWTQNGNDWRKEEDSGTKVCVRVQDETRCEMTVNDEQCACYNWDFDEWITAYNFPAVGAKGTMECIVQEPPHYSCSSDGHVQAVIVWRQLMTSNVK